MLGGGEENPVRARADPERTADAAGEVDHAGLAGVHPGGGHRAAKLLERLAARTERVGQGENRRSVDGHLRVIALEAMHLEDLVVVDDDPVVDPDHLAVADGVVVGLDRRMPLGVVAHVDQDLGRVLWDL
jgi:hypothetical protein